MNTLMLYTEDTYEVPEYPYFGAYRGRYSASELRELSEYADRFGIEMIPCIQALAHLKNALRWEAMRGMQDTDDILMAGGEEVYRFLEACIRRATEPFLTKRVHLGMDEALVPLAWETICIKTATIPRRRSWRTIWSVWRRSAAAWA